jgi:hypothetical protein
VRFAAIFLIGALLWLVTMLAMPLLIEQLGVLAGWLR